MISCVLKLYKALDAKMRKSAIILIIFMILGMVFEMIGLGLIIPVVAIVIEDDLYTLPIVLHPIISSFGITNKNDLLFFVFSIFILLFVFKTIYLVFLAKKRATFAFSIMSSFSQKLFNLYLHKSYSFHIQNNSSQLISNSTTECNQLISFAIPLTVLLSELLVVVGIISILVVIEPIATIGSLFLFIIMMFLFFLFTRNKVLKWGKSRQKKENIRLKTLQQGFNGIKEIKLHGCQNVFEKKYSNIVSSIAEIGSKVDTLAEVPRLTLELTCVFALGGLVCFLTRVGGTTDEILPSLGLFAGAAFKLIPSLNRIVRSYHAMKFNKASVDLVCAELNTNDITFELTDKDKSESLHFYQAKQGTLQIQNVSFSYSNSSEKTINNLSLSIERNTSIGIIGSSGSGKSTLVDIILGLLIPNLGSVKFNEFEISQDLQKWHKKIGYVPQNIYLTDDSIRNNIAFGIEDEKISDIKLSKVVHASQLDDFIARLPKGLSTKVGERGIQLSGGQLQRIGIARALYKDPEILIFDEATSALDSENERNVMQSIESLFDKKTVIIVAHRLSTLRNCHRIIRLDKGRISESGTPTQML